MVFADHAEKGGEKKGSQRLLRPKKIISLWAVAHIPGANIKEFLGTISSEGKRPEIPGLSSDGKFSERKTPDQKFFSVSGMGFGQQHL
jgi:hypothetical protein